jgi:hypothetical protein
MSHLNSLKHEINLNNVWKFSSDLKENTMCLHYKISCSVLFKEMIVVCSESHTRPINTLCDQNAEVMNVKAGGSYD